MDPASNISTEETQKLNSKEKTSFRLLLSGIVFLLFSIGLIAFAVRFALPTLSLKEESSPKEVLESTLNLKPSPTPFPFMEMTIPYLQTQTYDSTLGELKKNGENSSYTSYRTSYKSQDFTVNGLLTQPKGDAPEDGWPAIVFVHGYVPPQSYRTTQNYVSYMDVFAKQGFVVFKVDLRGHDQSEGDPSGAYYAEDYVIDVLSAREALRNAPFVNKDKVGLWGHSMAGNVLMRSLAVQKDIPAVAIWAGAGYSYSDMQKYGIQDNSYRAPAETSERAKRRKELFDIYGNFSPEDEFWKQVPATNYLDGVQGKIGLFHAVNDNVVNVGYSRDLKAILDPAGIENELHEYPAGGHNIDGSNFTVAMRDTVAFFRKYL